MILSLIQNAKHVLVCAVGNTIPVSLDCMFKFNEICILTFTLTFWENQASYALGLDASDVVIAISNSGESSQVLAVYREMKKRRVHTIGITNTLENSQDQMSQCEELHASLKVQFFFFA